MPAAQAGDVGAPLVAPAVDLSVIDLLLGTRYLALHGAPPAQLRPARRLLVLSRFDHRPEGTDATTADLAQPERRPILG
jgi:hypothetical protein